MRPLADIEADIDSFVPQPHAPTGAGMLLSLAEEVLEYWVTVRDEIPTNENKEGFRLLALHRQGARGVPSFNACRESCREIAYHYNLLAAAPDPAAAERTQRMMVLLTRHLFLFVSGKMQVEKLGEFCCASRPVRVE